MNVGEPVTLRETGRKGRICRDMGFNQYCVQFEVIGCLRVARESLVSASEPAPNCTPQCLTGC
jgi:hypothetical protein